MSRAPLGKDTVETPFYKKSNNYNMRVMCIDGYEDVLTEGEAYTVTKVTKGNNYILEEVDVPQGYTSFNSNRFVPLVTSEDDALEESFWSEQSLINHD
jgi:hypothetical protein